MQVKLLLFIFYLNGGLHAVSVGKPSEWMSNFWTVRFSKTESEPNFDFFCTFLLYRSDDNDMNVWVLSRSPCTSPRHLATCIHVGLST